ncbi:GNAT family N-acetyltransferase [Pueribacillus theae]|nr:GNAT family N-acetyltransferase [Pueribacillus theae]
MKLVWSVFLEFEAPDYTAEGINTFRDFINNEDAIKGLEIYGAYEKGNLIGVIATRNEGNHIALFFVHGKYHKQGVGRKLFEAVLKNSTLEIITVNSSPYAVEIYHKLGFVDTDIEQIKEGMRFTPMKYQKYE